MRIFWRKKKSRGFTIIETMVAISLFLIIVMVGMDALLNANVVHQKSQDLRSIIDSLSFIMEDMSRNIRTGYNYHCVTGAQLPSAATMSQPQSCASGWALAFEAETGFLSNTDDQWVYYVSGGKIWKGTQAPYTNPPSFVQLNPDEVVLDATSGFSVLGAERVPSNNQQPLVTIRLAGKITYKNVVSPFALQTTVSQRLLDILP